MESSKSLMQPPRLCFTGHISWMASYMASMKDGIQMVKSGTKLPMLMTRDKGFFNSGARMEPSTMMNTFLITTLLLTTLLLQSDVVRGSTQSGGK